MKKITNGIFTVIILLTIACSEDILDKPEITYSDIEWGEREYKVHKCPVVNRTGYGIDLFRDTLANPNDSVDVLYMDKETEKNFNWDIKFYNEYAVTYISWSNSWNTLANASIFMHPKTKACIVGQGVKAYENFSEADIDRFIQADSLEPDKAFPGDWEYCREPTTGRYILKDIEKEWLRDLVIGIHMHPGHTPYQPNGPCDNPDQVNTQPLWLIKTSEGAYVKFQLPLFKGSGADMQKCTIKWKTLRAPGN